jgi:hypothetical protein
MNQTNICFSIGDHSTDGHGCYAEFIVKSNKPVQEVREVHFLENETIGSIASEYQESTISLATIFAFIHKYSLQPQQTMSQIIKKLTHHVKFQNWLDTPMFLDVNKDELPATIVSSLEKYQENTEDNYEHEVFVNLAESSGLSVLTLWTDLLMIIDPTLELTIISEALSYNSIKHKGYPVTFSDTIHFYGIDDKNRHFSTPGYGVWRGDEYDFSSPN